jgi:23S rRNA (cytidine1920-2'-O)/16S rRNA (cytidine1409-2'-O)-methyltransferase
MRADQALVVRGIAVSRSQAQRVLATGGVLVRAGTAWRTLSKGDAVEQHTEFKLVNLDELKYVSRGGLKLAGALTHTGQSLQNKIVLDVGQSTGGFTDCALQHGAAQVIGVDVGHGQLAQHLHQHPQVICLEGLNARNLTATDLTDYYPAQGFEVIVGDVSFISQTLILPALARLLVSGGRLLFLVKPQFELQADDLSSGGIVRDPALYAVVESRIRQSCELLGLTVLSYFSSPITGGDGNQEFFVWAEKPNLLP